MKLGTRLLHFWHHLRQTFWFVPTLITLVAALCAQLSLTLDDNLAWSAYKGLGWIYSGSGQGASTLLSTIVGSMITATSVTFSMTLVALTLTSSQFGPRLLQNFMRRPGSQVVLGTFLATFTFSLLVLRSVQVNGDRTVVPHLSVTVAVGLALASVGVLIYFIHHIATSIQADTIISQVYSELIASIDRIYPTAIGQDPTAVQAGQLSTKPAPPSQDLRDQLAREGRAVYAQGSGYLQAVDADALLRVAQQQQAVLLLHRRPGHFITHHERIATLSPAPPHSRNADDLDHQIWTMLILGEERTSEQDVEFAILQLVEVALRALSPGINDPHTAIRCIDWLGAALCRLRDRASPHPYRYDEQGRLRVITDSTSIAGLTDVAFHQIRQASEGKPALFIRLLEAMTTVARQSTEPDMRQAISRHGDMVLREARRTVQEPLDRDDIEARHRELTATLSRHGG